MSEPQQVPLCQQRWRPTVKPGHRKRARAQWAGHPSLLRCPQPCGPAEGSHRQPRRDPPSESQIPLRIDGHCQKVPMRTRQTCEDSHAARCACALYTTRPSRRRPNDQQPQQNATACDHLDADHARPHSRPGGSCHDDEQRVVRVRRPPRATGLGHQHDGSQHLSVPVTTSPSALGSHRCRRTHPLEQFPQRVRHQPFHRGHHDGQPSFRASCDDLLVETSEGVCRLTRPWVYPLIKEPFLLSEVQEARFTPSP